MLGKGKPNHRTKVAEPPTKKVAVIADREESSESRNVSASHSMPNDNRHAQAYRMRARHSDGRYTD